MKHYLLLALIPLLLACSKNPDETVEVQETVSDCQTFISKLPADYRFEWLIVPENPADPKSPSIHLFYAAPRILKDKVMVFFNGGPGFSTHGSFNSTRQALEYFGYADIVSAVFIDQRGTGCSEDYPRDKDLNAMIERDQYYGSRQIVEDAEVVRHKLIGDKPWYILGQSFGGTVSHRYMMLHPNSIARAASAMNMLTEKPMQALTERIYAQTQAWERYFDRYPSDRAIMTTLLTKLDRNFCFGGSIKVCGDRIIDWLTTQHLGFITNWASIHRYLQTVLRDGEPAKDVLFQKLNAAQSFNDYHRLWALNTIAYYDRNVAFEDYENCSQIKISLARTHLDQYLTECSATLQLQSKGSPTPTLAAHFGHRNDWMTIDDFANTVRTNPGRFLLYSAAWDPYVPTANFLDEVKALGSLVLYRDFAATAHEGYRTQIQIFQDLFL